VEGGLAVKIELVSPPSGCAVFELGPEGVEVVPGALRAKGGEILDFKVASFLDIVIICDEVGVVLCLSRESPESN
jgi:hypothetical protein